MAPSSIFKPEGSIVAGLAVVGLVWADYSLHMGSAANVHASSANHPVLEASRMKAGYTAAILVAGVALIARDPNIVILGGAAIIVMEISMRHAIMSNPETGQIVPPQASAYLAAVPA